MRSRVSRRKRLFLVLALCLLSIGLCRSRQSGEWLRQRVFAVCSPAAKAGGWVVAAAGAAARSVHDRRELIAENSLLKSRTIQFERLETLIDELRCENGRLSGLLALKEACGAKAVAGRVVRRDRMSSLNCVTINAGSNSGVRKDMAVLAPEGVVGRIWSAAPGAALVQLITDSNSGTAAFIQRTRLQGILIGTGSRTGQLEFIPKPEDVEAGDRIFTSGLDGIYPKGHLLGTVESVEDTPGFFKKVNVSFAVAFNKLEEVVVLPGAEIPGESPGRFEVAVNQ